MEIKEQIAVMQAFAEGKEIEVRPLHSTENDWVTGLTPVWNWTAFEYRIKPESKHRPYTFEELQAEMAKGKIAVKRKVRKSIFTIIRVCEDYSDDGKIQLSANLGISYETFLNDYTWLDGSPCGVIEEEDL